MAKLKSRIALPYIIYFKYLDPIFALGGAYLLYTDPVRFTNTCTPSIFTNKPISPLSQLLLNQIISLYIMHALITGLVLRASTDLNVWRAVVLAICAADIGHLWALYAASPMEVLGVMQWRPDDFINYGILSAGLALRVMFLLGVGIRR